MEFKDVLNRYLDQLGCSAKELAESAGISAATLSRYRTGAREPESGSGALEALAKGIARLAAEKGISGWTEEAVSRELAEQLSGYAMDPETLRLNFDTLLKVLGISVAEAAKALNYDPSYLSRIRSGLRRPADLQKFAAEVARFAVRRCRGEDERTVIAELLGLPAGAVQEDRACLEALVNWLTNGLGSSEHMMAEFLQKLDQFNLDEYIRLLNFDRLKVPTAPFQLPTAKTYTGLKQMMEAELDFLKSTVLSKSMEPVIMYGDTPMGEMAKDSEFPKKWMFGLAMMLKKGLHLHQIHSLDRSFEDMMLGLENWIPLYMTGQISPYYLKGTQNGVFLHLIRSSGTVGLLGEAIAGFHEEGRYQLSKNKEDVAYCRNRAKRLLAKAAPLMDIYRQDSENVYKAFCQADAKAEGRRRTILSSLPLYAITDSLARSILEHNRVAGADQARIMEYVAWQRAMAEEMLARGELTDEYPEFSPEEFAQYPMTMPLSGMFYEKDVVYTYAQYREHLGLMEDFAAAHPNYRMRKNTLFPFRHIQIFIREGSWVMVSKSKAPAIHFVIRHPRMREAIENMVMPIVEDLNR